MVRTMETFWDQQHGNGIDDWIAGPAEVIEQIKDLLCCGGVRRPRRVLVTGCGTSGLSEALNDYRPQTASLKSPESNGTDKLLHVVSMDISRVAIATMNRRRPDMEWVHGDCTALQDLFPKPGSFDLVVDKGTYDTLLFRAKRRERYRLATAYLAGVSHLLGTRGHLVMISPRPKVPFLSAVPGREWGWSVNPARPLGGLATLVASRGKGERPRAGHLHVCVKPPAVAVAGVALPRRKRIASKLGAEDLRMLEKLRDAPVLSVLQERCRAQDKKNYPLADALRTLLRRRGIIVEDTMAEFRSGTGGRYRWRRDGEDFSKNPSTARAEVTGSAP